MSAQNYKIVAPKILLNKDFMLGLAEKPTAARRIAVALSGGKAIRKNLIKVESIGNGRLPEVEVYSCDTVHGRLTVISAVGHLFTLVSRSRGSQYPIYNYKWVSIPESKRSSRSISEKHLKRIEAIIEAIRYLAKHAKQLIVLTDYDAEGEVIGGLTFQELSSKEKFRSTLRMKFSSLTDKALTTAYDKLFVSHETINKGLYHKGLMRHYLDWLWGVNLSRALISSLKNNFGRYYTLSTGRVQGPTLAFLAERQREIDVFVPIPLFKITANLLHSGILYPLQFTKKSVSTLADAKSLIDGSKDTQGLVKKVQKRKKLINAPVPYNLSALQREAYSYYKLNIRRTLQIAEKLYLSALITYPRTSSEQFAEGVDHRSLIKQISEQPELNDFCQKLLGRRRKLKPSVGKNVDPAHPAISPTGQKPGELDKNELRIYELVVRRYLSTFGEPAVVTNTHYSIQIGKIAFSLSGVKTVSLGWWEIQQPVQKVKRMMVPSLFKGERVEIDDLCYREAFTSPPARYNESSLLRRMETEEIGTKATRADIMQALLDRNYITGDPLNITRLGKVIYQVLNEYSPDILSVELSRKVERMGAQVESSLNLSNGEFLLNDAILTGIEILHRLVSELFVNEEKVGRAILRELTVQTREEAEIGKCLTCKKGNLIIIRNPATGKRFVGCTQYFNEKQCEQTFPIPRQGKVTSHKEPCTVDDYPVLVIISKKRPWKMCVNNLCPSRMENDFKAKNEKKVLQKPIKITRKVRKNPRRKFKKI